MPTINEVLGIVCVLVVVAVVAKRTGQVFARQDADRLRRKAQLASYPADLEHQMGCDLYKGPKQERGAQRRMLSRE